MKKIFTLLLISGLAAGIFAGCSSGKAQEAAGSTDSIGSAGVSGETSSGASSGGKVFTYARDSSTTSFDLHREITMNNAFAIDKVFEPLVIFDQDGNLTDWLAKDHSISSDGLTYTFTLRDGVQFSDGTPMTAKDVVYSINRHLSTDGPLPLQGEISNVSAPDDHTVVITLGSAYTPFLAELANFSNGILPENLEGKSEEDFFKNPVGTGPFAVSSWDSSGDLTFVKNEHYWREGEPKIDKLVYKTVSDGNQALNQLKAGEVDAVESLSYANAEAVNSAADTRVLTSGSWNVEELFFNTLDEHFSDVHVRQALAQAIDRENLTKALTFGYGETANTILPNAIRYNTSDTVSALAFHTDAAKQELSESAYPDGFSTSILIPSGNNTRLQEAQIIQAAGQSIGITIQIDQQETAAFRDSFMNLNYSMMINSATADYPDADSIFSFQVDPDGFSKCYWTSYHSDDAAALWKAGQTEPDGDSRAKTYADLQQLLAEDVPYLPLYYPNVCIGVRSNVSGLEVLPNGSARFNDVTLN